MSRITAVIRANSREAMTSLRKARLRTVLGLIGITIGISSVITMISLGEIAKLQARKQFEDMGTNILVIRKAPHGSNAEEAKALIRLSDAMQLPHSVPSIIDSTARISGHGKFRHAGKEVGSGNIQGVTESFARINLLAVRSGRFISDFDVQRQFCVVGSEVATAMREAGTIKIEGSLIDLEGNLYTVIGSLAPAQDNYALPVSIQANTSVFIPITTAGRLIPSPKIDVIVARNRLDADYETINDEVTDYFSSREPNLRLDIVSAKRLIKQMEAQMRLFTLLLAAIGSISLIVGGIGIMNIMLVSVNERQREIAIRRALGARRGDIQSQFLIESVLLTMAGGFLGIGLGLAATYAVCQFTGWDYAISPISVVSGIGTATLAGVFFGFQPARQAARLDPIAGLQGGG